ncbi:hypothetical protein V5O48_007193 [Marasmius crinis-equi]|uniref:Galactose oxidase n=1 Tax=Marasmius crinis-equi TaxID=585013 RepID=A0ABR3FHX7_9AGAR
MSVRTPLNDVPEHGPFTPTSPSPDTDMSSGPYFSPQAAISSTTLGPHSISGRTGSTSTVTYSNSSSPSSPSIVVHTSQVNTPGESGNGSASGSGSGGGSSSGRTRSSRKPSGSRTPTQGGSSGSSSRRTASVSSNTSLLSVPTLSSRSSRSPSSTSQSASTSGGVTITAAGITVGGSHISSRFRVTPKLPQGEENEAPPTLMYWSRAPVWGLCPTRTMRGHTVTLVGDIAWVFGGCDDKDTAKDLYCFDVETNQWSYPETLGELPPPSRAHSATLIDRHRILIFGGGQAAQYSDAVHILDTSTRKWTRPIIEDGPEYERPAARRAHTAVFYKGKVWVFGGGNGMTALNDVWALDVGVGGGGGDKDSLNGQGGTNVRMEWQKIQTTGVRGRDGLPMLPSPRGYHTANLIGNMMIVIGGSDGKDCFAEVWCLNLDTLHWTLIELPQSYKRLSHTATQVGSYLFIQGGHDGAEYVSDMKLFNLITLQYESRPILGKAPVARGYHVSLLHDSRIFYFGGYNGTHAYDDVYVVDLAAAAYLPQVTSFTVEV